MHFSPPESGPYFCARWLLRGWLGVTLAGLSLAAAPDARTLSLEECLDIAFRQNHRRPASQYAVAAAEAQHRQALSAYWPQLALRGGFERADEAANFLFPAMQLGIPAQAIAVPASTALVTVPAGVLGPTAVQLPVSVPAQTITTPAQAFAIPAQDVKLLDRDTTVASLDAKWLVLDGGLRRGLDAQTQSLVAAMRQEARRNDLEIADSVRRYYHGAVLARQLLTLGTDTLERMQTTLRLTETLYQGGGGKVTKSDYLDNKVMVETLRAFVATLEQNDALAQAALANAIGLPWTDSVAPSATEIPFAPLAADLPALVGDAYQFSPDWARLEAGLRAAEAAVGTAKSGYAPKVAVTGQLRRYWNSYDAGLSTATNRQAWSVGVGLELPLFDGQLTRAKVAEMRARLGQLKEQQLLLKEGLGLQIKDLVLRLAAADKSFAATRAALDAATENRDLTIRAYQSELVDTEKVIRAQLVEALMTAQHLKIRYDHVALASQLDLAVGRELQRQLARSP